MGSPVIVVFLCFYALQLATSAPSSFPSSGVELHHSTSSLPLYPQLNTSLVGNTDRSKLWCSSASNRNASSISWKLPGGTVLNSTTTSGGGGTVMLASTSSGASLGLAPSGASLPEGIYKCCVTDENGNEFVLESTLVGRFRPRFSDTRCSQVAVSPNRYLLGTSLSYMSPTNVVCRDQGDNIITSSGTVSRRMINDTSYRVGFTFPRNTPFTVTCSISNGPSGTITTVSMTCIGSSSISLPALPSTGSRFVSGTSTIIGPNTILSPSFIRNQRPLWCQGSGTGSTVTWTLPDGTVMGPNSPPSGGVAVISGPGQLGLIPSGSDEGFPSGVYTCTVNGTDVSYMQIGNSGDFTSPMAPGPGSCNEVASGVILCANLTGGLPTSASCSVSGSPFSLSSLPTRITKATVPIEYRVCVPFPSSGPSSYTCTFSNNAGSVSINCNTLSPIPPISGVTVIRNPTDPTQINVNWNSINSPFVTGYNVTVTGSDGSTRSISVRPGTANRATITNVIPQNSYSVTVKPIANDTSITTPPSRPVIVPPATTGSGRCNPAEGYIIDVVLTRNRSAESNCTTIAAQRDFAKRALEAALGGNNALISNCTDPIMHVRETDCSEDYKDKTKSRNKTPKFPKFKTGSKKSKKTKKTKKGRTKTPNSATSGTVYYGVRGLILCGSCVRNSTVSKRDIESITNNIAIDEVAVRRIREGMVLERMMRQVRRMKRKHGTKGTKKTKSTRITQQVPSMVNVNNQLYNVYFKEKGLEGMFCGNTTVSAGTTCECPSQCMT